MKYSIINHPVFVPEGTNPSELIIALSQDRVDVHLMPGSAQNRSAWQTSLAIDGMFASDQVAAVLDKALILNPALLDDFSCVSLLIMDRPNLCIPAYLAQGERLVDVAARHLRIRSGDVLTTDDPFDNNTICYSMPADTITVLQEYYRTIGSIHVVSLLWKEIRGSAERPSVRESVTMYATILHHQLIILAERNGKLMFSRHFIVREQDDVYYFALACQKLLKAEHLCWITIRDEFSALKEPRDAYFKFNIHLAFASLPDLLAKSNPCVS